MPAAELAPHFALDNDEKLPRTQIPSTTPVVYWAPFDDRVGYAAAPLTDYDPTKTILWKYVEGNRKVFQCPKGYDTIAGSTTLGQPLQISYAMNGATRASPVASACWVSTFSATMRGHQSSLVVGPN